MTYWCNLKRFIDHIEQYVLDGARSVIEPYYFKLILTVFNKLNATEPNEHYSKYILRYGIPFLIIFILPTDTEAYII